MGKPQCYVMSRADSTWVEVGGGGILPYTGYIGTVCAAVRGMVFIQAVYSSIGYINQSVWVLRIGYHFSRK